jgi:hypothetical protein
MPSVLIADVEFSTFVMVMHQIGIQEAMITDFYVRVRSRPIIEYCSDVRFAPHALKYVQIEEDDTRKKKKRMTSLSGYFRNSGRGRL